jgi:hypothetical protein
MFYLLYASIALQPFSAQDLAELLQKARAYNNAHAITGMLIYRNSEFMQVLEGEQAVVEALYTKISRDSRHYRVTTILDGAIDTRHFPDWSMGFRDLADERYRTAPEYQILQRSAFEVSQLVTSGPMYQRVLQSFRYEL